MSDLFYREFFRATVTSFVWGTSIGGVIGVFNFVMAYSPTVTPDSEPERESVDGQEKVCTEFGTYRIRAPTPKLVTKAEHHRLCQRLVQRYEKETHNTWRGLLSDGPCIKRICGISLDDIRNTIPGVIRNTSN